MDTENILGLMEIFMTENLEMINLMDKADLLIKMENLIMENSKITLYKKLKFNGHISFGDEN